MPRRLIDRLVCVEIIVALAKMHLPACCRLDCCIQKISSENSQDCHAVLCKIVRSTYRSSEPVWLHEGALNGTTEHGYNDLSNRGNSGMLSRATERGLRWSGKAQSHDFANSLFGSDVRPVWATNHRKLSLDLIFGAESFT